MSEVRVAAASDLSGLLEGLFSSDPRTRELKVSVTYGSSGLLVRQLQQGAPFDLFLAADASFARAAVEQGGCEADSLRSYASGRLAVWQRPGSPVLQTLGELAGPRFRKVALANPAHAPYGRAGQEALQAAGVWPALEPRLVLADNVRQALQLAESGNAEAAVVALPLARRVPGVVLEVAPSAHAPLTQTLVVCRHGQAAAQAPVLAEVLLSPATRTALESLGFGPP